MYTNEKNIKEAIDQLLDTYKLRGKMNEKKLIASWEKVMGKAIAKYTTNLFIKNQQLYVELSSAVLRSELNMGKEQICKMLNDEVGAEVIKKVNVI